MIKPDRLVRVVLLALLLLGAFAAGQHFSGSAAAQARQKWEYQLTSISRIDHDKLTGRDARYQVRGLTTLGDDGWEAVSMNDSWVLLKRSK